MNAPGAEQGTTVYVSMPQHGAILPAGSKAVQSVIQANQASVIQSTSLQALQVGKGGNVILLKGGPNSVIQTGNPPQTVQVVESTGGSVEEDGERKQQRQVLVRRPSYRKIFNDLNDTEIAVERGEATSEALTTISISGQEYAAANLLKVIPADLSNMSSTPLMTYPSNDAQFIVPVSGDLSSLKLSTGQSLGSVVLTSANGTGQDGDSGEANSKRAHRLLKNREAARECRAKKKEYIKCLENRVAVLENQNKALIEELKALKALYCETSWEERSLQWEQSGEALSAVRATLRQGMLWNISVSIIIKMIG